MELGRGLGSPSHPVRRDAQEADLQIGVSKSSSSGVWGLPTTSASSEIEVAAAAGLAPEDWPPACSGSRGPKEAAGEVRALGARLIFLEAPSSATFGVLPRGVGAGFKRAKDKHGDGVLVDKQPPGMVTAQEHQLTA